MPLTSIQINKIKFHLGYTNPYSHAGAISYLNLILSELVEDNVSYITSQIDRCDNALSGSEYSSNYFDEVESNVATGDANVTSTKTNQKQYNSRLKIYSKECSLLATMLGVPSYMNVY